MSELTIWYRFCVVSSRLPSLSLSHIYASQLSPNPWAWFGPLIFGLFASLSRRLFSTVLSLLSRSGQLSLSLSPISYRYGEFYLNKISSTNEISVHLGFVFMVKHFNFSIMNSICVYYHWITKFWFGIVGSKARSWLMRKFSSIKMCFE